MIIKVIGAFLAVLAFAALLEVPKKYLGFAGAVGAVGWLVYLLAEKNDANEVFATFLSTLALSLMSHIFARICKTPVTAFLIPGIIPTVPGAGMYWTVYYLTLGNVDTSLDYLVTTLEIAGAIALGIFIVDGIFRIFQTGWKQNSLRYQEKKIDK